MMAQYSPTYRYEVQKGGKKQEKSLEFPYGIIRDGIEIELMASSEVMNTEVRREINLIVYQLLSSYATQLAGMAQQLSNPNLPPSMIKFIGETAAMGQKLMTRILRDFGIVDGESLVPNIDGVVQEVMEMKEQQAQQPPPQMLQQPGQPQGQPPQGPMQGPQQAPPQGMVQ